LQVLVNVLHHRLLDVDARLKLCNERRYVPMINETFV